jgi:hypothetical protein
VSEFTGSHTIHDMSNQTISLRKTRREEEKAADAGRETMKRLSHTHTQTPTHAHIHIHIHTHTHTHTHKP